VVNAKRCLAGAWQLFFPPDCGKKMWTEPNGNRIGGCGLASGSASNRPDSLKRSILHRQRRNFAIQAIPESIFF
jgi:hypothetical protein